MSGAALDRAAVVVAEHEALSRAALAEVLTMELGLAVAAETGDLASTQVAVQRHRPALLLLDLDLGRPGGGLDVVARVAEWSPRTRTLVVAESEDIDDLLTLLRAGASGYVPRGGRLSEFVRTVEAALRGEICLPRRVLGTVLATLLEQRRIADAMTDRYHRLSGRERQVLRLLSLGADNGDIARELVISPETVRTHVQNVMTKLGVHSRLEAAQLAISHGLARHDGGDAA